MEESIEMELTERQLSPAWRNVCSGLIEQAAGLIEEDDKLSPRYFSKQAMLEKDTAKSWFEGKDSVITFNEESESIGVDSD